MRGLACLVWGGIWAPARSGSAWGPVMTGGPECHPRVPTAEPVLNDAHTMDPGIGSTQNACPVRRQRRQITAFSRWECM
ncbi:MAG: hypothetical protein J3K34DRAFT_449066 [Monoraphidium minutum]|nr:MAG: hypothetical protein J3K34DRAFT_449066 [Monoraphidium minutum]